MSAVFFARLAIGVAALAYLLCFRDLIEGRRLAPVERDRRRAIGLAATIHVAAVLGVAVVLVAAPSPAPAVQTEKAR